MTTNTEAMRSALEAFLTELENSENDFDAADCVRKHQSRLAAALAQAEQRRVVPTRIPDALRIALEDFDSMESLGPTTEKVIDAAQKWYLAAATPQPEEPKQPPQQGDTHHWPQQGGMTWPAEPKQHAPGLCLESGEFVPAARVNAVRAAPRLAPESIQGMDDMAESMPAILRKQNPL